MTGAAAPALRAMRWQDIRSVARIEAQAFADDPWSEATFWAELARRPQRDYLVLQAGPSPDAAPSGYGGVDRSGETADLMTLAVAPEQRGAGGGRLLLRELMTRAADAGATRMLLEVRADNAPAIGLYVDHGFVQVQTRRRYYRDGADALVMQAPLVPSTTPHPGQEQP